MRYSTKPRARFDENNLVVLDIETISSEVPDDSSFPPWPTHTPIVASLLTTERDQDGLWAFELESVRFSEDHDALDRIDELIRGHSVVTFNGRGFDLPVLMLTAQKVRNFALPSLTRAATEPRFESALHYDLADRVSGYGAARGASLERLCAALHIPVKREAHGSAVGELYDRGDIEAIERYCETDVAATLLLYAHQHAMEIGDAGYHASLTWQFAAWCREQYLDHLAPYAELRDGAELQRLSLLGQLDAASNNARRNAALIEQRLIDSSFGEVVHY